MADRDPQLGEGAAATGEEKYRAVFAAIDEGFCVIEILQDEGRAVDYRYLDVNSAFERHTGLTNVIGRRGSEVTPHDEGYWLDIYGELARTGEAKRFENYHAVTDRWYDVYASRLTSSGHPQVCTVFTDVTDRKRRERNLAFLAEITADLSRLSTEEDILEIVSSKAAAHFGLDFFLFVDVDEQRDLAIVRHSAARGRFPPVEQAFRLSEFLTPDLDRALRRNEPIVVDDTATDPRTDLQAYSTISFRSFIVVPFHQDGQLRFFVDAIQVAPRRWRADEIELMGEIASRICLRVQRARAEAALQRNSESFASLIENSPFGVYVIDADFRIVLASRQAHKTFAPVPQLIGTDLTDAQRLIWPEPFASEVLFYHRRALKTGEPYVAHDTVEQRSDRDAVEAYDWRVERIVMPDGRFGVVCYFYDQTDRQRLEDALRESETRLRVLVAELQHRVRNILTVVRSVFQRTAASGLSMEDVADHFSGRLDAMARTQVMVTQNASGLVDLENMIREELLSVAAADDLSVTIAGPDVSLSRKEAESIGLAIHELTTNALKYGALRTPEAKLEIRWSLNMHHGGAERLDIIWEEQGVPAVPLQPRHGFGVELIEEALPYQLGAETELEFCGGGVRCRISMPLEREGGLESAA